jgi:AraC-like DNA-binding protein
MEQDVTGNRCTEIRSGPAVDGATQRIGGFTVVPALLRQFGVDPATVLASAGLAMTALDDPDGAITYTAASQLLHSAATLSGCAHFGLLVGRSIHLSDLGLVGQLALHSPTVGQGLHIFAAYQHLNTQGAVAFVLERDGMVDNGYAIYQADVIGAEQVYGVAMTCSINIMRELCGSAWIPSEVCFAHPRPADIGSYRRLFQCHLRFDAEYTALRFPDFWMKRAIGQADPERYRLAYERGQATATRAHLLQQVQGALRTLLISGTASGDAVAGLLEMHRRTLNRRLKEEGTTFQEMLDKVRFEVARQLLGGTKISIDDVAAALGYASVSPFTRTFRRWAGTTPGRWRRGVVNGWRAAVRESSFSTSAD